ncbi:MAG: 30S ribosome-binding factor RbfA [Deltaproteobacteria bacterium]|nr:30S ribosome-binding factor RbfA [Deltaproteobacteria bacterium]
MPGHRANRLAAIIHREVAMRLRTEIKDHRMTDISVTYVRLNGDLSRAVLEYMPLGGGEVSDDLRAALVDAARALRGPVGRALGIRHAPELLFVPDTHTEEAIRVSQLIARAAAELPSEE